MLLPYFYSLQNTPWINPDLGLHPKDLHHPQGHQKPLRAPIAPEDTRVLLVMSVSVATRVEEEYEEGENGRRAWENFGVSSFLHTKVDLEDDSKQCK